MALKNLNKSHNHSHFWVERCSLFESYKTIRGLRYRFIHEVLWPDTEMLSDNDIKAIEKILNGEE
jgi:hypothetical protein